MGPASGFDFWPRTFLLPEDTETLRAAMQEPGRLFMLKPKGKARGIGVQMLPSMADLPAANLSEWLVQDYLHRPVLLNGHKHTLRLYVAVTSWRPMRVYLLEVSGRCVLASCSLAVAKLLLLVPLLPCSGCASSALTLNFDLPHAQEGFVHIATEKYTTDPNFLNRTRVHVTYAP